MKKDKSKYKVVDIDVLEQINEDAAGIDIGVSDIYVAVAKGRDMEIGQNFSSMIDNSLG
jgi:hypothetical protein